MEGRGDIIRAVNVAYIVICDDLVEVENINISE